MLNVWLFLPLHPFSGFFHHRVVFLHLILSIASLSEMTSRVWIFLIEVASLKMRRQLDIIVRAMFMMMMMMEKSIIQFWISVWDWLSLIAWTHRQMSPTNQLESYRSIDSEFYVNQLKFANFQTSSLYIVSPTLIIISRSVEFKIENASASAWTLKKI